VSSYSVFCLDFVQAVENMRTLKMLGCFNPTLGQKRTNPNVGLKA